MKQVLQNIKNGQVRVADVPAPTPRARHVVIANHVSVLSSGTERMLMDLSRKSLLGKARERPDHVRRVLEKVRQEGLLNTTRQVRDRLDEPLPLGYASSGIVLACGEGVQGFHPGDRVASNGPHAGVVSIPQQLCAHIPEGVSFVEAAFTVLGSIALQGVRLTKTSLGETVFVIGLGPVGLLAVSLLQAAGCRVIATDPDAGKCEVAVRMGADWARPHVTSEDVLTDTRDLGADAVLIAAATSSNEPIERAADAVRVKGRIVLVGAVGLALDRRPFFAKEVEFVVSKSYGPGRHDAHYEDGRNDYPPGYVRWTIQRNFRAVLQLMADRKLDVRPLISHRFSITDADQAYTLVRNGTEPHLSIVLTYPDAGTEKAGTEIAFRSAPLEGKVGVGCLGAGQFARHVLLPALVQEKRFQPVVLCSTGGTSAAEVGQKLGFARVATDEEDVYSADDIDAVFVLTRHDQHARQVCRALKAGQHVFVEKPLALSEEELASIRDALDSSDTVPALMVGFNRRFSSAAKRVKELFDRVQAPLTVSVRMNAGAIAADHWTQDELEGGGRIIGEACHAIDLATYLTGSLPVRVFAEAVGGPAAPEVTDDQCFITIRHANGSVSNVAYVAGGDKALPKERVEVFGGGRAAVIDDFREVTIVADGRTRRHRGLQQDKGHRSEVVAFADALTHGAPAMTWDEMRAVTLASILAVRSLREGVPLALA